MMTSRLRMTISRDAIGNESNYAQAGRIRPSLRLGHSFHTQPFPWPFWVKNRVGNILSCRLSPQPSIEGGCR